MLLMLQAQRLGRGHDRPACELAAVHAGACSGTDDNAADATRRCVAAPRAAADTTPADVSPQYASSAMVRLLFFVLGFYWISVKGACAPPSEAPIVCPNHVTFLEPFYFFGKLLPMGVCAKEQARPAMHCRTLAILSLGFFKCIFVFHQNKMAHHILREKL